MPPPRSDEDRNAAIASLFRIRAVESPPDEHGVRTIWHRGSKGAELVSWLDAMGQVTRHELTLFDDVVVWDRRAGVQAGQSTTEFSSSRTSADLRFDSEAAPVNPRVLRAKQALSTYVGSDKIITHLSDMLIAVDPAAERPAIARTVSRPALEFVATPAAYELEGQSKAKSLALIAVGVALMALAVVAFLLLR